MIGEKKGSEKLALFENVQFIYELALAQFELISLGINFEITNGLREFNVFGDLDLKKLKKRLAYFKIVGSEYTDYYFILRKNRTNSVNQYLTHWIYPYKGKFHPQMIRALLNIIKLESGDTVLDPFIGSGTTALEAQLLGINCIGIDISPLCVLQSKVKTESIYVFNEILEYKEKIDSSLFFSVDEKKLERIISNIENEKVRNFYTIAKLVAISDNIRRKKKFQDAFLKNFNLMLLSVKDYVELVNELNLD
ncbi:MAG: DNA methyltransferase, partial [candidate division WOR-3 bacterium]